LNTLTSNGLASRQSQPLGFADLGDALKTILIAPALRAGCGQLSQSFFNKSYLIDNSGAWQEVVMNDSIRRRKLETKMDELFVPDYDANNVPSSDKRSAYALEHIALRVGLIDRKFDQLIDLLSSLAVASLHSIEGVEDRRLTPKHD
jgi:hypothetical protein